MSNGIPLTPERKAAFLAELARHGIAVRAARAASPQSAQGALSTFKNERQRDPEFAAAWEEALETARAEVDHELYRSAGEGYDEPVYGGEYSESEKCSAELWGRLRQYRLPSVFAGTL